jgi:DNA-binding CsgD family transcriptional regulator
MQTRHCVSLIEAAYAVKASDRAWLEGIAASARLTGECGACAYLYDASRVPVTLNEFVNVGTNIGVEIANVAVSTADEEYVSRTWRTRSVAAASEDPIFRKLLAVREQLYPKGVRDFVVINAFDSSGIGVLVGSPTPEEVTISVADRRTWSRIAAHLSTALRLRRRRARPPIALLSPGGRVEHAEGDAQAAPSRDALKEAVLRMERARGPMRRREPDAAVALWEPLVDARWTLLDSFESDGKRYVVAMENRAAIPGPEVLSARERQVVALYALGQTNKLIAYELGLSDSTVRVLLSRAAKKLGVCNRRELVALYRAHTEGGHSNQEGGRPGR